MSQTMKAFVMQGIGKVGFVIAVESMPERQKLSLEFGADHVIDHTQQDSVQAIRELTGGAGVDSAIECLGAQATFEACVKATRAGGTISVAGYFGHGDSVNIPRVEWGVGMGDKTIRTGLCPGGNVRMGRLLRLLENGRVDPAPLTTHRMPFHEVDRGLRMMETKQDGIIKPLIEF